MNWKKQKLAIVDIETTGARWAGHRIIDIAVLRVEGEKLVDSFCTLVNPERPIPPSITFLTGIRDEDVFKAPTFADIRSKLKDILKECIFVAHNARFDYGFIQSEFLALEQSFRADLLCTVRLSRKLFPHCPKHDLSALIERFNLTCQNRHRALDDASVIWEFLQKIREQVDLPHYQKALLEVMKKPKLPVHLLNDSEHWPEEPGAYIFYDEKRIPLYVGQNLNVRQRILSHFAARNLHKKKAFISKINSIEIRRAFGPLGAKLLEYHLIKSLQPLYNRCPIPGELCMLRKLEKNNDYIRLEWRGVSKIGPQELSEVVAIFRTRHEARQYLQGIARTYNLCPSLIGLDKNSVCPEPAQHCRGACRGKENVLKYSLRLLEAMDQHRLCHWPFRGSVRLEEKSPFKKNAGHVFTFDRWCLLEALVYEREQVDRLFPADGFFDPDVYRILYRYLNKNIKKTSEEAL